MKEFELDYDVDPVEVLSYANNIDRPEPLTIVPFPSVAVLIAVAAAYVVAVYWLVAVSEEITY